MPCDPFSIRGGPLPYTWKHAKKSTPTPPRANFLLIRIVTLILFAGLLDSGKRANAQQRVYGQISARSSQSQRFCCVRPPGFWANRLGNSYIPGRGGVLLIACYTTISHSLDLLTAQGCFVGRCCNRHFCCVTFRPSSLKAVTVEVYHGFAVRSAIGLAAAIFTMRSTT